MAGRTDDLPPARQERRAREAAALRDNLRRRKAQARAADPAAIAAVLDFWFLPAGDPAHGTMRDLWFRRDAVFDAAIGEQFMGTLEAAAAGLLDSWSESAAGALALVVLLDQFPRNLFRGQARAFATDAQARAAATTALAAGFDRMRAPVERVFFYLPFEHSEDLADQERAVSLFEGLPPAPWRESVVDYAYRHRESIRRFGRFPARNHALGRESTSAELAFLAEHPMGF